jgi:hypothetical protein
VADASTENTTAPKAPADSAGTSALDVLKAANDKAYGQGFIGEKVDPNPNEVYTIAGVIKNMK